MSPPAQESLCVFTRKYLIDKVTMVTLDNAFCYGAAFGKITGNENGAASNDNIRAHALVFPICHYVCFLNVESRQVISCNSAD